MAMQIEKTFVLRAPRDAVWDFLTDPEKVARCLPGAAITGKLDEHSYGGTMTVKVGPVTANYRGKMRFDKLDAAAGEAEIVASGQETRGKGGADMRMKSRVAERQPGETEVTVTSDVNVVGVLAQFGRGMIQDVSDQLFQKFTDCMRRQLEAPAPPAPAEAAVAVAAIPESAPANLPADLAPPPAPPPAAESVLDVGALGAAAAGRAAKRTLSRPGFWVAVVVLALLLVWLLYR
jgi:hypothetical protein